jgi:hypothetical protein
MRNGFSLFLMLFLTASVPPPTMMPGPDLRITAMSVPLDTLDPNVRRVGQLQFRGGWVWQSAHPWLGGLSSLRGVGNRFLAVGDAGTRLLYSIDPGGAISAARMERFEEGPGRGDSKADRDAESLALDMAGNTFWVGFESSNEIWRYDLGTGKATGHFAPPLMKDWPANGGAEALVRLADGRFIAFSEAAGREDDRTSAVLFSGDPVDPATTAEAFTYRPPTGFRITDAAQLPDGRLVLLHRRFTIADGVAAQIAIADPMTIRPGAVLESTPAAWLRPPLTVDNMEGLALTQENGRTILWVMSDDNYNPLQRTLLLKFALIG